jgi:hypothetical protein
VTQPFLRGLAICICLAAVGVLGCDGDGYDLIGAPPPEIPPSAERVPLTEMGTGTYLGFTGGLYPQGYTVPSVHDSVGRVETTRIVPRDAAGNLSASGKYVLLSIGMSNTTQEFCGQSGTTPCNAWTFMGQAAADPAVNRTTLVIANGAAGGKSAAFWDDAADPDYDRVRDQVLPRLGVTEWQVQVAWVKVANPGPSVSLPNANADAYTLLRQMGAIARAMRQRYPNLRQIFFSSRIFGGFATTSLNPEPYAYESGFAVKWVVQAQIDQRQTGSVDQRAGDLRYDQTPWLAWGPYLWSGNTGTPLGSLAWVRSDLEGDGTHPAQSGEEKVGAALLSFFKSSPYTACWFLAGRTC